jgi:exodeoxyribonuclease X
MAAYVLDTELTDKVDGQIIEAAWIRMPAVQDLVGAGDRIDLDPRAQYQTFEERYKPTSPISFGAMAVHHILPSELEHCPPHTLFQLPDDVEYLIGHSIDFDWHAAGTPLHVKRICTHAIAQHLFDDCDAKSLTALLYFTYGPTDFVRTLTHNAHTAMGDCWNTVHFLRKILDRKPEITTWSQLWEYSEACRIPLRMPHGRNRGALITDLESSEIDWYLARNFIDPYLRKAMALALEKRGEPALLDDDFDDEPIEPQRKP